MNLNKANLSVSKIASKDDTQKQLQTIVITKQFTAATDGYKAAFVTYPDQFDKDELPVMIQTDDKDKIKGFMIDRLSNIPNPTKKKGIPCLNQVYIDVHQTNANGSAFFTVTDLDQTIKPEIKKVQDVHPLNKPFQKISDDYYPNGHVHTHTFTIDYLIELLQVAKEVGKFVTISMPEDYKAMELTVDKVYNANGQEFSGIIMPIRE